MNIQEWIVSNLEVNSTIIEAGTAGGSDTKFFSDYFTNGKIYGFEPIHFLYQETLSKVKDRSNVEVYNSALSDKSGISVIYQSDRFGQMAVSSSLLKPKEHLQVHPEITFKEEIEVECINLDDFCSSKNINLIDLMWLDMQGYEPIVLKASPNSMSMTRYIYAEVSLIETYENVIIYPEFKEFMFQNGFEPIFEDLPWVDMGNVLFKNKKLS